MVVVNREDLVEYRGKRITGDSGYYLGNKDNTLRYTYMYMFRDDLKKCKLFKEGITVG